MGYETNQLGDAMIWSPRIQPWQIRRYKALREDPTSPPPERPDILQPLQIVPFVQVKPLGNPASYNQPSMVPHAPLSGLGRVVVIQPAGLGDYEYDPQLGSWFSKTWKKFTNAAKKVAPLVVGLVNPFAGAAVAAGMALTQKQSAPTIEITAPVVAAPQMATQIQQQQPIQVQVQRATPTPVGVAPSFASGAPSGQYIPTDPSDSQLAEDSKSKRLASDASQDKTLMYGALGIAALAILASSSRK